MHAAADQKIKTISCHKEEWGLSVAKMSKNINKIMVQWMWRLQVIDQDRLVTMIEKILENNKSLNYVDFSRFSG